MFVHAVSVRAFLSWHVGSWSSELSTRYVVHDDLPAYMRDIVFLLEEGKDVQQ
jgi:hypothetical protein